MDNLIVTTILAVIGSVTASGGFWAYLNKRAEKKDARTKMVLGLGHDRLLYLCMIFIDRGEITQDEFENLHEYLYRPYIELGGNGTISKLMEKVDSLPIIRTIPIANSRNIQEIKSKEGEN